MRERHRDGEEQVFAGNGVVVAKVGQGGAREHGGTAAGLAACAVAGNAGLPELSDSLSVVFDRNQRERQECDPRRADEWRVHRQAGSAVGQRLAGGCTRALAGGAETLGEAVRAARTLIRPRSE